MEPECSLPCSQEPFTSPYPESAESSPYHPHSISLRSMLILSSYLCLYLLSDLFPSGFPMKTLHALLSHPCYMSCPSFPPWFDNCVCSTTWSFTHFEMCTYEWEVFSGWRGVQEAHTWVTPCLELVGSCCSSVSGDYGGLEQLVQATRLPALAGIRTPSICHTASPGTHCNREADM
jgi:hypothetical protein